MATYSCGYCWIGGATYRDQALWVGANTDTSRVDKLDHTTGNSSTVYRPEQGSTIIDLAVFDGALWIVVENQAGDDELRTAPIGGSTAQVVEGGVLGVVSSTDGRYLAYGVCGVCGGGPPRFGGSAIVVRDRQTGSSKRLTELRIAGYRSIAPVPTEWSSDGAHLPVQETWEGSAYGYIEPFAAAEQPPIVPLSGLNPQAPEGFESAEAACFVDPTQIAIARWSHPYAEGEPRAAPIVVRGLDSSDDQPYGDASVIGSSMACPGNGAVVIATHPDELTGMQYDVNDRRLERISPVGTATQLATGINRVLPI